MIYRTIVIGGGPAGLTAACFSRGPTLVLERLAEPARKLLATGGGRCNLTHATDAEGVITAFGRHARFMMPALKVFDPSMIRAFFKSLGVATCVEPDGCVFPVSQKASEVVQALEGAARANGAKINCGVQVTRLVLEAVATPDGALPRVCAVETADGVQHRTQRVILAAGGQASPMLGSDGSGFKLANDVGLKVTSPVPGLAGLMTQEAWPKTLAGLVLEEASAWLDSKGQAKRIFTGPLLFTHKGISGPPALNLAGEIATRLLSSNQFSPDNPTAVRIRVSMVAARKVADWVKIFDGWRTKHGGRAFHNLLAGELPRAVAQALCEQAAVKDLAVARVKKEGVQALASACAELPLHIVGTEAWSRAMVTRGGVALSELAPDTLCCRRIGGLACAGEIIDLDGPCGGYNLTWAFASGHLAGRAVTI